MRINMRFTSLAIKDIRASDDRFKISPVIQYEFLLKSIKHSGLLNPPVIIKREGAGLILSGWRRIAAARALEIISIPVYIFQPPDDQTAFEMPVYENEALRGFTPVEKAGVIAKFIHFGADKPSVLKKYLTLLSLPPSLQIVDDCLAIHSFEDTVKKTVFLDNTAFPVLQKLTCFSTEERTRLMSVLKGLSKNSQIEVLDNIMDIMGRERARLDNIFESLKISRILGSKNLSQPQKSEKIRQLIRHSRYPELSKRRLRFKKAVKALNTPENITLLTPKNFEQEGFQLSIRCRNREEYEKSIKQMGRIREEKELNTVFEILNDD